MRMGLFQGEAMGWSMKQKAQIYIIVLGCTLECVFDSKGRRPRPFSSYLKKLSLLDSKLHPNLKNILLVNPFYSKIRVVIYLIFTIFFIGYFSSRCGKKNTIDIFNGIEINKKIVWLTQTNAFAYSSNKTNTFKPSITYFSKFTNDITEIYVPVPDSTLDYFVQSSSFDEMYLSLLEENKDENIFQIYIYNIRANKTEKVSSESNSNEGVTSFSPTSPLLAYLSNYKLKIYDYSLKKHLNTVIDSDILFKNIVWSEKGKYLFLNDNNCNIWRYDISRNSLLLVWASPQPTNNITNLVTPVIGEEGSFLFISDMGSWNEFDNIYKFESSNNKVRLKISSNTDKILFQKLTSEAHLYYKENRDGFYDLRLSTQNSDVNILNLKGVVYDFIEIDSNKSFFLLYSDYTHPASVYKYENNRLAPIFEASGYVSEITCHSIPNEGGLYNLVFTPLGRLRGWVVWLHGGPFEQVSKRFNPFIYNLAQANYGTIVLNYPGSTGAGNKYEYRLERSDSLLEIQFKSILKDIVKIKHRFSIDDQLNIIGVSYGSILAHLLCNRNPDLIKSLIDFSGLYDSVPNKNINTLYIFGDKDFTLNNSGRELLLEKAKKQSNNSYLNFKDEGHIINRRSNIRKTIESIINFLNHEN